MFIDKYTILFENSTEINKLDSKNFQSAIYSLITDVNCERLHYKKFVEIF